MQEVQTTADRGAIMKDGHLIAEGTPAALLEQYGAQTLEEVFERAVKGV